MKNAEIITRIMNHPALLRQPPVLIDIGASGGIHKEWAAIALYSTSPAFDDGKLKLP